MRKVLTALFLGALLISASCASQQRIPQNLNGIKCENTMFDVNNSKNTLDISFDVIVPANYFERRVTFTIIPELNLLNGKTIKLPKKSVQGITVVDTDYPVVDWSIAQVIKYKTSIDFSNEVADAVLNIDGRAYNCLNKADRVYDIAEFPCVIEIADICPYNAIDPFYLTGADNKDEFIEAYIYYPVSSGAMSRSLEAQPEISKAMATLKNLALRSDFNITKIDVEGNASPEGNAEGNNRLAMARGNSTRDYVLAKATEFGYKKDASKVTTVTPTLGNGIWEQFYKIIRKSNIANKQQMEDKYLSLSQDATSAEAEIRKDMAISEIRDIVMPKLRYGYAKIYFDPLTLTVDEMKSLALTHTEALSNNEIIIAATNSTTAQAIAIYEKAIDERPSVYEFYVNLAGTYIENGQFNEAEQMLSRAARLTKDQESVNLCRAYLNIILGNTGEASAALNGTSGEMSNYYKGIVALMERRYPQAVELLKGHKDANYAVALMNCGEYDEALDVLNAQENKDAFVWYCMSVCYSKLTNSAKATECRERATSMNPNIKESVFCEK